MSPSPLGVHARSDKITSKTSVEIFKKIVTTKDKVGSNTRLLQYPLQETGKHCLTNVSVTNRVVLSQNCQTGATPPPPPRLFKMSRAQGLITDAPNLLTM